MTPDTLLVVDDDEGIRFPVRAFFTAKGYRVEEADGYRQGLEVFSRCRPDVVLLDYVLPDGDALDLMAQMLRLDADLPIVILTGHGSIDLAVQAVKDGAQHFLTKPVELPTLHRVIERMAETRRLRHKQAASSSRQTRTRPDPFLGCSSSIRELHDTAVRLAESDRPVLLLGETGSGKGVLARWLHEHSPRRDEAYVDLNCAGLSRELMESELFGHERGAFTGAVASKKGLFDVAHRGTLLLDEIGDVDPVIQPKLLKVLEEMRFRRVGDVRDRIVDVRLIAATHRDLGELMRSGGFRSDLYFRIAALPLKVPPLRERREDIGLLARSLLANLASELGRSPFDLDRGAEQALLRHPWPGNIRELRNVLEYAIIQSDRPLVTTRELRFEEQQPAPNELPTHLSLQEVERVFIERVLAEEDGHVAAAAARLGVPRSTLYQKLKRFQGAAASKNGTADPESGRARASRAADIHGSSGA